MAIIATAHRGHRKKSHLFKIIVSKPTYEQWKYPPQINMHNETSDPSAVHSITYIEKVKIKALRWNLGFSSLEYSMWKYLKGNMSFKAKVFLIIVVLARHLITLLQFILILLFGQRVSLIILRFIWFNSEYLRNAAMGSACPTFYSLPWRNYLGQSFIPTVKRRKKFAIKGWRIAIDAFK